MSTELPLEMVRHITSVVEEVRVASLGLPKDERAGLIERRESSRRSKWRAESQAARPLQRRS